VVAPRNATNVYTRPIYLHFCALTPYLSRVHLLLIMDLERVTGGERRRRMHPVVAGLGAYRRRRNREDGDCLALVPRPGRGGCLGVPHISKRR
jgi:hypothetical protein